MQEEEALYCSTCGLPLSGAPSCSVCGGTSAPLLLSDGDPASAAAYAPDAERPELAAALAAWLRADFSAVISDGLSYLGAGVVTKEDAVDARNFKTVLRGVALFVQLRREGGELVVEAPAVRLPLTQYVPAMRLLLELSGREETPVRFSVRGELVLARYMGKVAALQPSELFRVIEGVAMAAFECARLLTGALQARAINAEEHLALGVDPLGRGIHVGEAVSSTTGGSTRPPPRRPTPAVMPPSARPPISESMPAVLMGGLRNPGGRSSGVATGAVATGAPPPLRNRIKTPATGLTRPPASALTSPPTSGAPIPLRSLRPPTPPGAATKPAMPRVTQEAAASTPPSALETTRSPTAPTGPDPLGDTFIGAAEPSQPAFSGPGAALSQLLHHAQALGTVLSFADQPATMCLLIRATVYRALREHRDQPDAVSLLFSETHEHTQEIYITAPGKRRGAMAIPNASAAFEVMARIVANQGLVEPPAEPLPISPITTAQDAKQHIARYVSEIEQAPKDLELRQFLSMGALSELLVRTKLPGPTQERLVGIIEHSKGQGNVQKSVDLMMTALTRMMT